MQLLLSDLLRLEGIEVESYQEREGGLVLNVEAKSESATCLAVAKSVLISIKIMVV